MRILATIIIVFSIALFFTGCKEQREEEVLSTIDEMIYLIEEKNTKELLNYLDFSDISQSKREKIHKKGVTEKKANKLLELLLKAKKTKPNFTKKSTFVSFDVGWIKPLNFVKREGKWLIKN